MPSSSSPCSPNRSGYGPQYSTQRCSAGEYQMNIILAGFLCEVLHNRHKILTRFFFIFPFMLLSSSREFAM